MCILLCSDALFIVCSNSLLLLFRFDVSLEKVLRNRRRAGRHMPFMNVIPPGLDFSNLKVDLPEDPVIKEMLQHKPAYGGVTPKAADSSPKAGGDTPRKLQRGLGESSELPLVYSFCFALVRFCAEAACEVAVRVCEGCLFVQCLCALALLASRNLASGPCCLCRAFALGLLLLPVCHVCVRCTFVTSPLLSSLSFYAVPLTLAAAACEGCYACIHSMLLRFSPVTCLCSAHVTCPHE